MSSVSSVFSVQFNQFSQKTQILNILTFIEMKYVFHNNKTVFLLKKGVFYYKYKENICVFGNLRPFLVIFAAKHRAGNEIKPPAGAAPAIRASP